MFEGLKLSGLESLNQEPQGPMITITEEAFEALIDNQADISPRHVALVQMTSTQKEIAALIAAIETYGLSRSLLAFSNYNGALSSVVASIPALESLTDDLSPEASTQIIADLKTLNASITMGDEPAEESVGLVLAAIAYVYAYIIATSIYQSILENRIYNTWKDDKEGRLAKIVSFKFVVDSLNGVAKVPEVIQALGRMELPKTAEALNQFKSKMMSTIAPLKMIGVNVTADAVHVDMLPVPVKANIETLGYHEKSLVEIGDLAEKGRVLYKKMSSSAAGAGLYADVKWKEMSKEERKYAMEAYDLVDEVVHASCVRVKKLLKLVKSTVSSIKDLYEEAE